MSGIVLIVTAISLSLTCMALGFGIIYNIFHDDSWNKWYIVFQSCLFGTILLGFANTVTSVFLSRQAANVFNYIFSIMQHATTGFIIVLLPFFLRWIIGKTWGSVQRWIFFTVGIIYFAAGLVGKITKAEYITVWIQSPVMLLILLYTIIDLLAHIHKIENPHSQRICRTISIVTLCLIPTDIAIELFPFFKAIGYSVYVAAISIIMIVYFSIRFKMDRNRVSDSIKLSSDALAKFKISDRETQVIKAICQGKTNKEIASEMCISVNTVNNHVANIFEKMDITSRVDLVRVIKDGPWS